METDTVLLWSIGITERCGIKWRKVIQEKQCGFHCMISKEDFNSCIMWHLTWHHLEHNILTPIIYILMNICSNTHIIWAQEVVLQRQMWLWLKLLAKVVPGWLYMTDTIHINSNSVYNYFMQMIFKYIIWFKQALSIYGNNGSWTESPNDSLLS